MYGKIRRSAARAGG